jgi:hypothetical protein
VFLLSCEITVHLIARIDFLTVKLLNGLFMEKDSRKTKAHVERDNIPCRQETRGLSRRWSAGHFHTNWLSDPSLSAWPDVAVYQGWNNSCLHTLDSMRHNSTQRSTPFFFISSTRTVYNLYCRVFSDYQQGLVMLAYPLKSRLV